MSNYIKHHGIKGMKWGVRRFQNKDGSLTPKGKKRYSEVTWDGPLPKLGEIAKMQKEDPERYAKYKRYEEAQGWKKENDKRNADFNKQMKSKERQEKIQKNLDPTNLKNKADMAKNLYDQYGDAARKAARDYDTKETRDKIRYDLSKMSDNELKNVVNRLNMEERYTQVMMSRHAENGKSFAEKLIDGAGTALVLGTSALALAEQMKKLKANK